MTARAAREGLAQGLNLLQTPGLPPEFLDCAEPIARAMNALMQAERSDGAVHSIKPHSENALVALRQALGKLQTINTDHPAAEQSMQAVAAALGHVHNMSRLEPAAQPQPAAYQPPPFQPPPPVAHFQPAPQPHFAPPPGPAPQFAPPPPAPQFAPHPPANPPPPQFQQPAHNYGAAPVQQTQWQPPAAAPAFARMPPQAGQFTPGAVHSPSQSPPAPTGPESLRPPGTIEAELGAHSPSNFYKTLSGNDIVEHGGIFVATYNVPKLSQRVQLRVHLPGGYQFDAAAIVRWTREGRDNPDAPPGFGAQFQGITPEQRQLIMRYARNREPLFYDDL